MFGAGDELNAFALPVAQAWAESMTELVVVDPTHVGNTFSIQKHLYPSLIFFWKWKVPTLLPSWEKTYTKHSQPPHLAWFIKVLASDLAEKSPSIHLETTKHHLIIRLRCYSASNIPSGWSLFDYMT